jgi:hypothetical protein
MSWAVFRRAREQADFGTHFAELQIELGQKAREPEICGRELSGSGADCALEEIVMAFGVPVDTW